MYYIYLILIVIFCFYEIIKNFVQSLEANNQRQAEVNRATPIPMSTVEPFMSQSAQEGTTFRQFDPAINKRTQQGHGDEKLKISLLTNRNIEQCESKNEEIEDLCRQLRSILNKLTPQKFETSVQQIKELPIDTMYKLEVAVNLIYEKAIDELNFSVLYAYLSRHLALIKVPTDDGGGVTSFRKLLLAKCQKEFEGTKRIEKRGESVNKIKAMIPTKDEEEICKMINIMEWEEEKMRKRELGNIKFVGELFNRNMLIEPIIHECIKKLLAEGDEISLECVCLLLKTVGKTLGDEESKHILFKDKYNMDSYFIAMQKIVDKRLTCSRIRFLLQDVIELKKNNWIPRREDNYLKIIEQTHEEIQSRGRAQQAFQNISYSKGLPGAKRKKSSRKNKFFKGLKGMLLSGKYSDFIINVKGKEFRTHKNILAVHSPVFASMFEHDISEKNTNNVNIEDCEPDIFSDFLNFLYTGRIENLNSDKALRLYKVADKYQVVELCSLCVKYLTNNISIEIFFDILTFGLRFHVNELIDAATQFFLQNSKQIAVKVEWLVFLKQYPAVGNKLFLKILDSKK